MTKQNSSNDFVKNFYAPKSAKIPQNKFLALQRRCGSREIQPTMRNGARADFKKDEIIS
jgi:hypothetical protein